MKPINQVTLIILGVIILSACSINKIQRQYSEEEVSTPIEEVYIHTPDIIYQPVYFPVPVVINQPEPAAAKTKVRTNNDSGSNEKQQRETGNNKNVRNNSGQRNSNARGK